MGMDEAVTLRLVEPVGARPSPAPSGPPVDAAGPVGRPSAAVSLSTTQDPAAAVTATQIVTHPEVASHPTAVSPTPLNGTPLPAGPVASPQGSPPVSTQTPIAPTPLAVAPPPEPGRDLVAGAVHLAVGTAWWATGPLRAGGRLAARAGKAVLDEAQQRTGWLQKPDADSGVVAVVDQVVQAVLRPIITRVVDVALAELDLTEIVLRNVDLDAVAAALDVEAVIKRVDLDGVVATVDLDAAVRRVDLDQIISRIDIDGIVAGVDLDAAVARVDLDAVVNRVDVEAIIKRVDIDGVVATVDLDAVVKRLDLNGIADGLDLDPLVAKVNLEAVVDRLDIAAVVAKVDPDPIVARVDFDAALAQIDLIGIAQKIVDGIDLPGIIRDSTGSLASEAVHGVRVQGQQADDAVGQLVGRVFRRRPAPDGSHPR
jgi:hypothetical protein